jgi:peptidoglycan/LPS O-acetylase OafA/YrhL
MSRMVNMNDSNRVAFLDNLRTIMVLLVLVFHSGASYGSSVEFWPFHDVNPSKAIDLFLFFLDMFMMAVLFFVAGYFALPSIQKKGVWQFLRDKFKRLGIPWLIVIFLLLPALDYVHYWSSSLNSGLPTRGYGEHWLLSIKRIAGFNVGWMNMSTYLDMTVHFYQRYMWYVSLLIAFFVVFALLHAAKDKAVGNTQRSIDDKAPPTNSIFLSLALTGFLTVLLFALVKFFLYSDFLDKGWFTLGNVIQFQCGKLIIYGCYFGLGIYAYSRNWFAEGNELGRPWAWGLGCFLLFVANMFVLMKLNKPGADSVSLQLGFVVLYPLWTLSFLGLFVSFAARHWNRATPLTRELGANSYNMYLTHYVFPMTIPLLLHTWTGGPAFVKFGIVALTTIVLSYGVSRYIITPYPRATVIGLVGLSIVLAAVT